MQTKKIDISTIKAQIIPILRNYKVQRAGLFGSYARGEANKRSDIDVVVDIPARMGLLEIVDLKNDLQKRLHKHVDLVEYSAIKPRLKKSILNDHVTLI